MAPMCMYSAQDDGLVTPFHHVHYATRAAGQVGLIVVEATSVAPEGRISNKDLGIWDDTHIAGLTQLVDGMKAYGAKLPYSLLMLDVKQQLKEKYLHHLPLRIVMLIKHRLK